MPKQPGKPLKCKGCGRLVGVVRPKLRFRRKMILAALGIALIMQIIAEAFVELVKWFL